MLNNVNLQCRLVADPEMRDTNSGVRVANFRVAWNKKVKDRESKLYLECKAFGALAEHISKYYVKGQETIVDGELVTEEWKTKEGENRSKIVLILNGINFCGKKADGAAPTQDPSGGTVVDDEQLPF